MAVMLEVQAGLVNEKRVRRSRSLEVEAKTKFGFAWGADREHAAATADSHRVGAGVSARDRAVDGPAGCGQAAEGPEVREIENVEEANARRNGHAFAVFEGPTQDGADVFWPSTKAVRPSKCARRWKCQHKKLPKKEKL